MFLLILLVAYYILPKRCRWMTLLVASLVFYCWGGHYKAFAYLLCTSFSTWLAALIIDRLSAWTGEYLKLDTTLSLDDRKKVNLEAKKNKKIVFIIALVANLLILLVIKYSNFAIKSTLRVWMILGGCEVSAPLFEFLVPLGISFYTFQSLGYLIDVYWGKYGAEKNFAKYLLFVSYFPQIVQGPIGRYDNLAPQLVAPNLFHFENLKHGATLMLWGYMKKLVIADRLAPFVVAVCKSPEKYEGSIIGLSILFYAIQLYADFSGGIDIVSGASEMFGIRLTPNFMRPYFASSLGDFWRRWHISLGAWMRDYVFYPFARSSGIKKVNKLMKEHHRIVATAFPAMAGNIIVFFLVGLWHGAELRYVVWGFYNGAILALSVLLKPFYDKFYKKFPKLKENPLWHGFQVFRTFFIVWLGYFFDCAKGVRGALTMMKRSVIDFHPTLGQKVILNLGLNRQDYLIVGTAVLLLILVSALQEKGVQIRQTLDRQCTAVRWLLLYGLIFFVIAFAATGVDATEGFMYAIF